MKSKNNPLTPVDRLEEYSNLAFEIKKAKGKDKDYYILIRHDYAIQCVAKVVKVGIAFYESHEDVFQDHIKMAALDPNTVIHTIGIDEKLGAGFTGRLYLPSHPDAYETNKVLRDVTGIIL